MHFLLRHIRTPLHDLSIHFLGGGNMAEALIGGLLAADHDAARLSVTEPNAARTQALAPRGVRVQAPGDAPPAQVFVVAVKPQQIEAALAATPPAAGATVLSIAAGVRCATLRKLLPESVQLVRSMPNLPAQVGAGITALYIDGDGGDDRARKHADYVMRAAGETVWLDDEALLDAVTALSGSGPAYVFALTEAMAAAGRALGLPEDTAELLARHTTIGAGALMAAENTPAGELRARVTSPGGTTAAALAELEAGGFAPLLLRAIDAARARAVELSKADSQK